MVQKRLEQYVARKLLPALGCSGRHFSLRETSLGIHNHVFYLDIEGHAPLVVKGIEKRDRFNSLCACSGHLADNGIAVPRIIHAEEDKRLFGKLGFHVVCEERIEGETLFEHKDSSRYIAGAARFFSRMHNATRTTWGRIDEARTTGLYKHMRARMLDKLKKWELMDASFPLAVRDGLAGWLKPWEHPVDALRSFSLSHGDPNPGNIIVTADNRMFLLDTGHIRYMPRAIDLCMLEVNLCRGDAAKVKIFHDAYLREMSCTQHEALQSTEPFFRLFVLIDVASMLAQRMQTTAPGQAYYDEYVQGLARVKELATEIMATNHTGHPA